MTASNNHDSFLVRDTRVPSPVRDIDHAVLKRALMPASRLETSETNWMRPRPRPFRQSVFEFLESLSFSYGECISHSSDRFILSSCSTLTRADVTPNPPIHVSLFLRETFIISFSTVRIAACGRIAIT